MRPASTTAVTIALLAGLLTGCTSVDRAPTASDQPSVTTATGPAGTATGTPQPTIVATAGPDKTSGAAARVMLRSSGGFTGRGDAVTVEPDGQWTAVDRAGSRRNGRLTPADLGRLTGLAADPRLAAEARQPTTSTVCSDAFQYRLTVDSIESGYVDCPEDGPPPPATQAVVKLLLRATAMHTR
ncbi:hypothetical protein [Micromonospora parathelypteridis]|uniref:Secreted protein n=1 Tax=Micromonospora parathelypteridis TaxID=1839617 RepID=A0A840VPL6_9ACTN|nr:hypothetical protein [Micromonospora parathelypteridis]MBB5477916.1 hypothetical protein [Micromonospora parathelypteridis]